MTIYQCPKCELRFVHESEVIDHLEVDHHRDDREEPDVPSRPRWHVQPHRHSDQVETSH